MFHTDLSEIIMSASFARLAQIVSSWSASPKKKLRMPPRLVKPPQYISSLSNYTRRELMFDAPHSDNVKLQVVLFSCVCWQHLSGRGSQCSDGWLSVLSDYFCCLYFPFGPRKIAAKLLTCSESHYVSTSIGLEVPFRKGFTRLHL